MTLALIGGGSLAHRLRTLLETAGHAVVTGVRNPDAGGPGSVSIRQAAEAGDIVILAIPYLACANVLPPLADALAGKIVVDATNPLDANWGPLRLGEENSGAEEIARLLPGARIVKAFNMVFADVMTAQRLDRSGWRATVFVCSDSGSAKGEVLGLATAIGFDARDAGPLRNARYLEAMAHLNIHIAVALGGGTNAAFLYDARG